MKKFRVPIFTEEYVVYIFIGTAMEWTKECKRMGYNAGELNMRGKTYHFSESEHPFIWVDSRLKKGQILATLAHEASHAMDFIADFLSLDEKSGEFHAHGIAAIMRTATKLLKV